MLHSLWRSTLLPAPLSSYTYLVTFQLWKHPAVTFPGPHLGCGMLAETMTEWQQMLIPWTVTTSLLNPQLCPAISLITQLCLHFPYRFLKNFPNYLKPLMALPLPSFSANDLSPSSATRSGRSLPSALHTIPIHSSFPPCSWMSFFPTHCSEDSPPLSSTFLYSTGRLPLAFIQSLLILNLLKASLGFLKVFRFCTSVLSPAFPGKFGKEVCKPSLHVLTSPCMSSCCSQTSDSAHP